MHARNERYRQNYLLFIAQYSYTKIAQRIFKYSGKIHHYTSLTLDKN